LGETTNENKEETEAAAELTAVGEQAGRGCDGEADAAST
jgi:hypothetical protein